VELLQREGNLNVETSGGHVTLGETLLLIDLMHIKI